MKRGVGHLRPGIDALHTLVKFLIKRLSTFKQGHLCQQASESTFGTLRCKHLGFLVRFAGLETMHSLLSSTLLLRKEVIQPHLPIRLPCYDLAPIRNLALDARFPCGLP
jgi:hypothetical protein